MENYTMQIRNIALEKCKKEVYAITLSDGLQQITGSSVQGNDDNSSLKKFTSLSFFFFPVLKHLYLKAIEKQS